MVSPNKCKLLTRAIAIAPTIAVIISLNVWLVLQALGPTGALASAGPIPWIFACVGLFCAALLVWITFAPLRPTPSHTPPPQEVESMLYTVAFDDTRVAPDGTRSLL